MTQARGRSKVGDGKTVTGFGLMGQYRSGDRTQERGRSSVIRDCLWLAKTDNHQPDDFLIDFYGLSVH